MADLDALLGATNNNNGSTSQPLTTPAASASGVLVVVVYGWWSSGGAATLSAPTDNQGGTYSIDVAGVASPYRIAICSRYVSGSLPSGAIITGTFSAATGSMQIQAFSFTGIQSSGFFDKGTTNSQSTAAWSTTAQTNATADALYVAVSDRQAVTTNTPGTGTEIYDTQGVDTTFASEYLAVSSAASRSLTGTWGSAGTALNAVAIYDAVGVPWPPDEPDAPGLRLTRSILRNR